MKYDLFKKLPIFCGCPWHSIFALEILEAEELRMLCFRRLVARRRFRVIARDLPARLFQMYGGGGLYKAGQVSRAIHDLKLQGTVAQMAFAIACSAEEFLEANPTSNLEEYARLRAEFMRLFEIDIPNFTMVHVRRLYRMPGGSWHEVGANSEAMAAPRLNGEWGNI